MSDDLFSNQAALYARFRPSYPKKLYEFLISQTKGRQRAWDCATGSGQVALDLAAFFKEVIATDISQSQLDHAPVHERIRYKCVPAESSGIEPHSVDLVTVGQAFHWFDFGKFHAEVKRVLKPGGVFAVWGYKEGSISFEIDRLVAEFTNQIVGPYWAPQVAFVNDRYKNIPFPFFEINVPEIYMEVHWDLNELLGYFESWSATQSYMKAKGSNPLDLIEKRLHKLWRNPEEKKRIHWHLAIRAGR